MRDFFAGLRLMLAYVDLERLNLGALVHQFIRDEVLPRLQKNLEKADTDTERDLISRLILEYEKYSDPLKPESKIYDKTAANIIRTLATRSHFTDEEMEDLSMEVVKDFLQPRSEGANYLHTGLVRLFSQTQTQGPLELNKLWMRIVNMRAAWRIRMKKRHHQEKIFDYRQNDEGEEIDPISQIPAEPELDESYKKQIETDLIPYMHRKLKRPEHIAMFDRWFELVRIHGNMVDKKHDIYPYLRDQGWDSPNATMSSWWETVRNTVLSFFEEELDGDMVQQVKRMLKISSVEILTYETYRRHLAAWMLSGIVRRKLEAGE